MKVRVLLSARIPIPEHLLHADPNDPTQVSVAQLLEAGLIQSTKLVNGVLMLRFSDQYGRDLTGWMQYNKVAPYGIFKFSPNDPVYIKLLPYVSKLHKKH